MILTTDRERNVGYDAALHYNDIAVLEQQRVPRKKESFIQETGVLGSLAALNHDSSDSESEVLTITPRNRQRKIVLKLVDTVISSCSKPICIAAARGDNTADRACIIINRLRVEVKSKKLFPMGR